MTDVSEIKKSLSKIHPYTDEQLSLFIGQLSFRSLKKKNFLLTENQVSEGIAYVINGSFRFFKKLDHGELTLNFFVENNWVADLESLLSQQPSMTYIEALEDSEIALISLVEIHRLMDIHSNFQKLNALVADLTISTSYIATISSKSPDERYKELLLKNPEWINRFPQKLIASYLGMKPETLSRVRARLK